MHDLLFENQKNLSKEKLESCAKKLKLDLSIFKKAVEGAGLKKQIEAEVKQAIRGGANGTPTFFVNGKRYEGDWSFAPFFSYLETQLSQARMS
jgi:protein-disulfide isomerase